MTTLADNNPEDHYIYSPCRKSLKSYNGLSTAEIM